MSLTRTIVLVSLLLPSTALAFPVYRNELQTQSGQTGLTCSTCHRTDGGGRDCDAPPCLRAFGSQVARFRTMATAGTWWSTVAGRDAEGDGYANGLELGDIDGDGRVDGPVLSDPNVPEGDLDECANGMATCARGQFCVDRIACDPSDRPSFECSPTPAEPASPPAWLEEPWTRPIDVVAGEWVDVDTLHALNPAVPSACGPSGASLWLNVRREGPCAGRWRVERRWSDGTDAGPATVSRMSTPDCLGVPTELECNPNGYVGLDTAVDLVRVVGRFVGQLRVACVPRGGQCTTRPNDEDWYETGPGVLGVDPPEDAVACAHGNPGCDYGAPVSDGIHRVDASGLGCAGSGSPWLAYEATCTGVLRVESRMAWNLDPEVEPGATIGLHAGECPGGAELACATARTVGPGDFGRRATVVATTNVVVGETVYVTVAGSRQQEDVTIQCIPGPDEAHCAHCASRAECAYNAPDGAPFCVCEDRTVGDGIVSERGGSGCVSAGLEPFCEDAGLVCHENASCDLDSSGGARCVCDPGYFGSGFECVDENECALGTAGCGVNTRCLNLEGVPAVCLCEPGYSRVDLATGRVDCRVLCGDGEMGPGEECDDGNIANGDGCSDRCEVELNFRCAEIQSLLSVCENTCGDGVVDENEEFICDGRIDLEACGCRTPGADPRGPWLWLIALGALLVRRRRS